MRRTVLASWTLRERSWLAASKIAEHVLTVFSGTQCSQRPAGDRSTLLAQIARYGAAESAPGDVVRGRHAHVLVTPSYDSVIHPGAWTSEFLNHDYFRAVWPDQPALRQVGNGGFSLRSRRYLAAGADPRITELHLEDWVLCRTHRALLEGELAKWLEVMPDEFFRSRDARRLAHGMPVTATALLQRRRAACRGGPNTRLLGSVAALMNLLAPRTPTTP